jgi:hypothetical protein
MVIHVLIYAPCMREDIKLWQFLSWMLLLGGADSKSCPSSMDLSLGTYDTFLCFILVHPSHTVPPPGIPLRQIHFVVTSTSAEGKLSHLARLDVIIDLRSSRVLMN